MGEDPPKRHLPFTHLDNSFDSVVYSGRSVDPDVLRSCHRSRLRPVVPPSSVSPSSFVPPATLCLCTGPTQTPETDRPDPVPRRALDFPPVSPCTMWTGLGEGRFHGRFVPTRPFTPDVDGLWSGFVGDSYDFPRGGPVVVGLPYLTPEGTRVRTRFDRTGIVEIFHVQTRCLDGQVSRGPSPKSI